MTTIESRNVRYTVISESTSSSRINTEEFHPKGSAVFVPFIFGFLTLTTALPMKASNLSAVSQPMTICQTADIAKPFNDEDIFRGFITKIVGESKEMDPKIAEIVNRGYRDLLW